MPEMDTREAIIQRFIEDTGNMAQSLGLGRVVGQIQAYLYFSQVPRCLGDMQESLGISKGSASTCVRQLEGWGAVKKVWIKGDRRDFYEANDWFGRIIKNIIVDLAAKRFTDRERLYGDVTDQLDQMDHSVDAEFLRERIAHLRAFENKAAKVWGNPILQTLLR